jgi:hypothetical protein
MNRLQRFDRQALYALLDRLSRSSRGRRVAFYIASRLPMRLVNYIGERAEPFSGLWFVASVGFAAALDSEDPEAASDLAPSLRFAAAGLRARPWPSPRSRRVA